MYEGRRGRKHKQRNHHGACTFCKRYHMKGKKTDSCRGHKGRKVNV